VPYLPPSKRKAFQPQKKTKPEDYTFSNQASQTGINQVARQLEAGILSFEPMINNQEGETATHD
jgi:hypothetical protein